MKEFRIWTGASMAGLLILYDPLFYKCLWTVILLLCSRTCFVESQSCRTTQEAIDVKTYRSPIVVEGAIVTKYDDASVRIKVKRDCKKLSNNALKGERITIRGFGELNPCVEELSTFIVGTNYMFYISNVTEASNEFQLTGNPDTADKKVRNIVKNTARNGGPPRITSGVRSKKLQESTEFLAKCAASGNPMPDITWRKDNETVIHNSIEGLRIRTKKKKKASSQLRIKRVKKYIHEGTYTCVANNHVDRPVLSSAVLEICALECENGELNIKRCRCKCHEGWDGESCNVKKCAKLDCGSEGSFDRENCQCRCNEGFIFEHETCIAASTTAIADASCNNGWNCQNGGTCIEEEDSNGTLSYQCRCRPDLTGPRCETALCTRTCEHGTLDEINCECRCLANYTGPNCDVVADNHVDQCPEKYSSYCLNGGTCRFIFELQQPSCLCPIGYSNQRCQQLDLESPCQRRGTNYCLNGGTCNFVASENRIECICPPLYRGHRRCSLHVKVPDKDDDEVRNDFNVGAGSKKIVICLSIIFITLLIIVVLLLLAYIKNKNAREREIRERMEHAGRMGVPRPNNFSLATVPATSIELRQFRRPSAPQPQRYQSDGELGTRQGNFHSRSVDGRIGNYGSGSLKQNIHTPNGHTRRVSQASLQSARSNGSLRSGDAAVSASQKVPGKPGYEAVPLDNPDEPETPRIEVVDEETPLRTATMDEEPRVKTDRREGRRSEQEPLSTETESELESNNGDGDRVDDLNPQLEALQSHPALKEEQETEGSVGDCSSDLGYTVNPYVMESPVRKAPHRTRNRLQGSNGQPRHMGIYSNPMDGCAYARPIPTSQAIDIQDGSGYYAQRLKDVVENSPPSAV